MTLEPKTIKVDPDSELAALLEQAATSPLLLERNGDLFRLNRLERDRELTWESYNPEDVRAMLSTTVGTWADLDTEALITDLYRAREEGSRPADRP